MGNTHMARCINMAKATMLRTSSLRLTEEMHDKIISHLQAGKKPAAIKELKTNWEISIKHILNAYSTKTP